MRNLADMATGAAAHPQLQDWKRRGHFFSLPHCMADW